MRAMLVLLTTISLLGPAGVLAALPTIDQVYAAANTGHYDQAQGLLDEVLKAKPDSAKAYFVQAELSAARRDLPAARAALAHAEQLQPGLPFVKASTVAELRARLGAASVPVPQASGTAVPRPLVYLGLALIVAFVFFAAANRRARQRLAYASPTGPGYAQPGYPPAYGPGMGNGPGMGSGVLGGLATGAAVGAGIVAGEALMNRVLHGGEHQAGLPADALPEDTVVSDQGSFERLGGNDFGINDTGSWDSGGGSDLGGDDWG